MLAKEILCNEELKALEDAAIQIPDKFWKEVD